MTQLQKYLWLIDTIKRAGSISLERLSDRWQNNKDLSDGKPLSRATFNRWRDAIYSTFNISIACQRGCGYGYYIENDDDIERDELNNWILDSFAVSNILGENLALKDRIMVDRVPSGRDYLTILLEAMRHNRVVQLSYRPFGGNTTTAYIDAYCLRLFEKRWYVVAYKHSSRAIRLYALDRMEHIEMTCDTFTMPEGFSAEKFFAKYYGIVSSVDKSTEHIVLRAYSSHRYYMSTLPLHHSQQMIDETDDYADFTLDLVPTYDFIMKLLQFGSMIEVLSPDSLRKEMQGWSADMYNLYKND